MRRYDDPVDVRRGMVDGSEGPEQFLWRGRLWKVHTVLAHWVETGAWWDSTGARAVLGTEPAAPARKGGGNGGGNGSSAGAVSLLPAPAADLGAEREVWRVEASRGRLSSHGGGEGDGGGVFDLLFDWAEGDWRLARCLD